MSIKPGPEMNAIIAEKIFKLRLSKEPGYILKSMPSTCPDKMAGCLVLHYETVLTRADPYSTNIGNAWQVVEKVQLFENSALWQVGEGWTIQPWGNKWKVDAETAPMAICLAALKVVENERP